MPAKNTSIIDACIAGEASDLRNNCIAWSCLEGIRSTSVIVVLTKQLHKEWKDNGSLCSTRWLASMISKNRTCSVDDKKLRSSLLGKIRKSVPSQFTKIRSEMEKDLHLFEAAISKKGVVLSFDVRAARHYKKYISDARVQNALWVNPKKRENFFAWLKAGVAQHDSDKIRNQTF